MREHATVPHEESDHQVASRVPQKAGPLAGRRRRVLAKILLLFAGTVVGLALAEIAVRIGAAVSGRDPIIVSDARVGWPFGRIFTN